MLIAYQNYKVQLILFNLCGIRFAELCVIQVLKYNQKKIVLIINTWNRILFILLLKIKEFFFFQDNNEFRKNLYLLRV